VASDPPPRTPGRRSRPAPGASPLRGERNFYLRAKVGARRSRLTWASFVIAASAPNRDLVERQPDAPASPTEAAACHIPSSPCVFRVMTANAGGTAMLERVVYTTVFVSDQDRALDFYTNVLGFEQRADNPTPDGPRFLTVGGQRSRLPASSLAGDTGAERAGTGPHPGGVHHRDQELPGGVRGAEVARGEVRDGGARLPLGLYRSIPGPRRQPAAAARRPLVECVGDRAAFSELGLRKGALHRRPLSVGLALGPSVGRCHPSPMKASKSPFLP
jgi:catechol 2,3-dioxygenase-like lactoylglutathione lyase family enzyme